MVHPDPDLFPNTPLPPTCVEPGVVSAGEGDHDLPLVLDDLVVGYGVLAQHVGGDETHLVAEEGGALLP